MLSDLVLRGVLLLVSQSLSIPFFAQCDTVIYYWDSGRPSSKGCLENNQKVGYWEYYQNYPSLPLDSCGTYVAGTKNGNWKYFNAGANNNVIAEGEFNNDQKVGHWNELGFVGLYVDGKKEGRWIRHTANDTILLDEINYRDGKAHGINRCYYTNGQLKFTRSFKNGLISGTYLMFTVNGKLMESGKYKNGRRVGEWVECDENGVLISMGKYCRDMKSGTWTYYAESGKIERTERYRRGTLMRVR